LGAIETTLFTVKSILLNVKHENCLTERTEDDTLPLRLWVEI